LAYNRPREANACEVVSLGVATSDRTLTCTYERPDTGVIPGMD
jgi:hypothetical protein